MFQTGSVELTEVIIAASSLTRHVEQAADPASVAFRIMLTLTFASNDSDGSDPLARPRRGACGVAKDAVLGTKQTQTMLASMSLSKAKLA